MKYIDILYKKGCIHRIANMNGASCLEHFCVEGSGIHTLWSVLKSSCTPFCREETYKFVENSQPIRSSGWRHLVKETTQKHTYVSAMHVCFCWIRRFVYRWIGWVLSVALPSTEMATKINPVSAKSYWRHSEDMIGWKVCQMVGLPSLKKRVILTAWR